MRGDEGQATGTSGEPTGTTGDEPAGGSGQPEGGSAAGEPTVEQVRAELENEKRKVAQLLSQKSNWERSTREQPPPTPEPAAAAQNLAWLNQLQMDAANGDPVAAGTLANLQFTNQTRQEVLREIALTKLPEGDRPEVEKLLASGEFTTVAAAHRALTG